MARETEVLILGGLNQAVQMDALEGFVNTVESGVEVRITTKRHTPFGPAGEGVGRRMYLSIEHTNGLELDVVPVANGQREQIMQQHFHRVPAAGDPRRESLLIPTMQPALEAAVAVGMRATTFGLQIRSFMPTSSWKLQSYQVEAHPLHAARGRQEGE